jgi:hypothetical protein
MKRVLAILDELGLNYMVGGSFASSTWGRSRQTNDLDLILELPESRVDDVVKAFEPTYSLSRVEVDRAIETRGEFQLLDDEGYFKVDVFILKDTPFDRSAFSRRTVRRLMNEVVAPCSTSEDIVVQKLHWYDLGHRVSDSQWNDVISVIETRHDLLDFQYMSKWAAELGVEELLSKAKRQVAERFRKLGLPTDSLD